MPSHEKLSEMSLRMDVALLGNDNRDTRLRAVDVSTISGGGDDFNVDVSS